MEADLADLVWTNPPIASAGNLHWNGKYMEAWKLDKTHPIFKRLAVHCINNKKGWDRSILAPASKEYVHARTWFGAADSNFRGNRGVIVRMLREDIGEHRLIDLSCLEKQKEQFVNDKK